MLAIAPPISIIALLPEIVLLIAGCAVLLIGLGRTGGKQLVPGLTLAGILLAFIISSFLKPIGHDGLPMSGNGLTYGLLASYVRTCSLIVGFVLGLVLWSSNRLAERGEFFAMLLFSLIGVLLVGAASNLVVLFLALELVSIPIYVLVALSRRHQRTLEAGVKYFYLGAVSAALTAYGFSFLYGVGGSASLDGIVGGVSAALQHPGTLHFTLAAVGVTLSIGGLLFKVAAVPLHFYIADVYQGVASPVAGLLGFVPKLAGFVAIFKIVALTGYWAGLGSSGATFVAPVFWMLWAIALLSMTVGNALALVQISIRRMLAYSGIAHTGYMMLGVLSGPAPADAGAFGNGVAAVLYYIVIYGLANLAAFSILGMLRVRGELCETVQDVAGLSRRHPLLTAILCISMFTLLGLPLLPGFWGKLILFGSVFAMPAQTPASVHYWIYFLIVVGFLNTAVGAAYYLRVVAATLLYENDRPAEAEPRKAQAAGIQLAGLLILIFAVFPNALLAFGVSAASEVRELAKRSNDSRGVHVSQADGGGAKTP